MTFGLLNLGAAPGPGRYETHVRHIEGYGATVLGAPACAGTEECRTMAVGLQQEGADAIVVLAGDGADTLAPALAETPLPVVVWMGETAEEVRCSLSFANRLRRDRSRYLAVASFGERAEEKRRIREALRAAGAAGHLARRRFGLVGDAPPAAVPGFSEAQVRVFGPAARSEGVDETDVVAVGDRLRELGVAVPIVGEAETAAFSAAARTGAILGDWMQREGLAAFACDLQATCAGAGSAPFIGAALSMASGHGYGEGSDLHAAALGGALSAVAIECSWVGSPEPQPQDETILFSPRGAANPVLLEDARLEYRRIPGCGDDLQVAVAGRFRAGWATAAALWPGDGGKLQVLAAPGEVFVPGPKSGGTGGTACHFRPRLSMTGFFEKLGAAGAPPRFLLAYSVRPEFFEFFAGLVGGDHLSLD